jgi:hypothetical protein
MCQKDSLRMRAVLFLFPPPPVGYQAVVASVIFRFEFDSMRDVAFDFRFVFRPPQAAVECDGLQEVVLPKCVIAMEAASTTMLRGRMSASADILLVFLAIL